MEQNKEIVHANVYQAEGLEYMVIFDKDKIREMKERYSVKKLTRWQKIKKALRIS
jgi:hypothetical protein